MNAKHYYWCRGCRKQYNSYLQALCCCDPIDAYRCGECKRAYRDEKSANDCRVPAGSIAARGAKGQTRMTTKPEWPKGESSLERSYNIIAEWVNATTPMQIEHEQFSVLQKLIYAALEAKESAVRAAAFESAASLMDELGATYDTVDDQEPVAGMMADVVSCHMAGDAIRALASTPAGEGNIPAITDGQAHDWFMQQDRDFRLQLNVRVNREWEKSDCERVRSEIQLEVIKDAMRTAGFASNSLANAHTALRWALPVLEHCVSMVDSAYMGQIIAARDAVAKALGERGGE